MSEFKGTKGVWKVQKNNQVMCDNKTIADCENDLIPKEEEYLNAKLISHSYKMLIAMSYFVRAVENEEIIIQENTDSEGLETTGQYLYQLFVSTINEATTL